MNATNIHASHRFEVARLHRIRDFAADYIATHGFQGVQDILGTLSDSINAVLIKKPDSEKLQEAQDMLEELNGQMDDWQQQQLPEFLRQQA